MLLWDTQLVDLIGRAGATGINHHPSVDLMTLKLDRAPGLARSDLAVCLAGRKQYSRTAPKLDIFIGVLYRTYNPHAKTSDFPTDLWGMTQLLGILIDVLIFVVLYNKLAFGYIIH